MIYLLFGAVLFCNTLLSQTITVQDVTTLQPIVYVAVSSTDPEVTVK